MKNRTSEITMHVSICENELKRLKERWVEGKIYQSLVCFIDGLLTRRHELDVVYKELAQKLNDKQIGHFFECYLISVNIYNPESMKKAREDKKEFSRINKEIANLSTKLGSLLDERSQLKNNSHFSCDYIVRVSDLIVHSANGNGNFSMIKKDITLLGNQYCYSKYWPSISDLVRTLGVDAENLSALPTSDPVEVVTQFERPSSRDFLRAFLEEIEEIKQEPVKNMPNDFSLTDKSLAVLVTFGLDLDEPYSECSVKEMRSKSKQKVV